MGDSVLGESTEHVASQHKYDNFFAPKWASRRDSRWDWVNSSIYCSTWTRTIFRMLSSLCFSLSRMSANHVKMSWRSRSPSWIRNWQLKEMQCQSFIFKIFKRAVALLHQPRWVVSYLFCIIMMKNAFFRWVFSSPKRVISHSPQEILDKLWSARAITHLKRCGWVTF
jgi:hypothetical protein